MKLSPVDEAIKQVLIQELPAMPEPRWVLDIRGEKDRECARVPAVVLAVDCHNVEREGDQETLHLVLPLSMAARLSRKLDDAVQGYLYGVDQE